MKNKKTKKVKRLNINIYKSPVFVVLMFTILMAAFFIISYEASAQVKKSVETGMNYAASTGLGTRDLRTIIFSIVNVILGFLAIVAVLIIMYGGFVWMTSKGDPNRVSDAKNILKNAVIGLVIIFLAFSIVQFVFNMFLGALIPGGPGGPGAPPGPCTNCSALGGGIIESVYPTPGAVGVPRNTAMFVTYKELMDVTTMQTGAKDLVTGVPQDVAPFDNVKIYYKNPNTGAEVVLLSTEVFADNIGQKIFIFRPDNYMGDGIHNITYTVRLGKNIKKDNGDPAFPGFGSFSWSFTVGTKLDLIPPVVNSIFPYPDFKDDIYTTTVAKQAEGKITVSNEPKTLREASEFITNKTAPLDGAGKVTLVGSYTGTYPDAAPTLCRTTGAACATDAGCGGVAGSCQPASILNLILQNSVTCSGGYQMTVNGGWNPANSGAPNFFCVSGGGTGAVLINGIALNFNPIITPADLNGTVSITLVGFRPADTLQVSNIKYTFVPAVPTNSREIRISSPYTNNNMATAIRNAITANTHNPGVFATVAAAVITVKAALAGSAGNFIPIIASGSWRLAGEQETLGNVTVGTDEGFSIKCSPQCTDVAFGGACANKGDVCGAGTCIERCDEPRNAVIKIDFSETMMPSTVGGKVILGGGAVNGVGPLDASSFNIITVQADMDNSTIFDNGEYVEGDFYISNLYGTAEFIPKTICGTCKGGDKSGMSCTEDVECTGGGACGSIRNSCGDFVHCLPTRKTEAGNEGGITRYQVKVVAANLNGCGNCSAGTQRQCLNDAVCTNAAEGMCNANANNCIDPNFKQCNNVGGKFICQDAGAKNYPQANLSNLDGAMDAAINSLDGDKDDNTEGPSAPGYDFGKKINNGDTLYWNFYINNRMKLTPPHIQDIGDIATTPVLPNQIGVNLVANPEARFDTLLMGSSLKPGTGYRDGLCTCVVDADCPYPAKQTCINNRCQNKTSDDSLLCLKDSECKLVAGVKKCNTKKYVTLFDNGCVKNGSLYFTGWWITGQGYESNPPDGYFDFTSGIINHTPFCEMTGYGSQMGSGIKDVYQNCYLPSGSIGVGSCNATQSQPYCCPVGGMPQPTNLPYCCPAGPQAGPCA